MKRLPIVFLMTLVSIIGFGQTTDEPTHFKHYVGVDAGASNGYGLSYRYQPKDWGIQMNMFPSASKNEYSISVGATVLRTLFRTNKMQFFLYYGNHLMFDKSEDSYYYSSSYTTTYNKSTRWVTGVGPGFEVYIAKRLALNARFGVGYYNELTSNDWMINADGGIGLHFMF